MTILTKPSAGAKQGAKIPNPSTMENGAAIEQDENGNNDKLLLIQERTRRFTGSTLLLVLASLCLACMGVLIGLVIYRRVQLQRMHFHGMCNLPYDGQFDQNRDMLNMLNQRYQELDFAPEKLQGLFDDAVNQGNFFREEVDLDFSDDNALAKINVPDFRDGRYGRFLHDFKSNQTAIIDESAKRCFIMPLDRSAVLPPKSLADLILKMYTGYYDINPTEINKKMRVVTPALTDLTSVSPNIQNACDSMDVYRLEKYISGVFKRSARLTNDGKFAEFSGNYIHYDIINIDDLNSSK